MKKYRLLIIAILLGAFLRLYQLGSLPGALTWDEAALGYNAFSIIKTGRDEFGRLLPIIFKSFGDYKPGLYVYLAIPSIVVLGLTEFAVRLPSAIFGILSILGVYLLVKELFPDEKKKNLIASFSALSLAIMPLHIHFSRGAWETNIFVTFLLFSVYFLLRFIREGKYLNISIILAVLTFFTYQAAKMTTPLVLLFTTIVYWKPFIKNLTSYFHKRKNTIIFFLCAITVLILFISSTFGVAGNRLKRLSIFTYRPAVSESTLSIDNSKLLTSLFHNQSQLSTRLVAGRYLNHFSPKVLFYEGMTPVERGHVPNMGIINLFDFFWFVLGLAFLVKFAPINTAILIIGFLLLAPLPGSLTLSEYSTIRSLFMLIPLSIICGTGAFLAFSRIKLLFVAFSLLTMFSFFYFLDMLFVHAKFTYDYEFQYGYKEAMQFVNQHPGSRVVMTDVWGQPYIFYLFYSRFDPATYQKLNTFTDGGLDVGFVSNVGDDAEFHQFGKSEVSSQYNTIFIGTIGNVDENFDFDLPSIDKHEDVLYPNGDIMLRIIKTKSK